MVTLDKSLPYTRAAFLELLQEFEDMINGFTPSGTFKSPYEFVVVEDGTDVYGCNGYQVVYGGPDDAGSKDGGDPVAVIQACLDNLTAARSHPEKILLVGNFEIDGTITLDSYTTLEIIGKVTLADGTDDEIFTNSDSTDGNTNIIIRGLGGVLDGNKANNDEYAPVRLYGCVDSVVEGLTVLDAGGIGIYITESTNERGENVQVRFNTVRGAYHHGISADTDGVYVHHNTVDSTDTYDCIQVDTANRCRVENNFCAGATRDGIRVMTYTVDYGCYNIIKDNEVSSCTVHGINIEGASSKVIYDNVVSENKVYGCTQSGIRNHYAQDTFIYGNEVRDCERYGIEFYDANCVRGVVDDNKIYDMEDASGRGIIAYQDYVVVRKNYIDNCTQQGIEVRGDHNQILSNTLLNIGNYGIYLNTAQYSLVSDNKITTAGRGIHAASSGYNVIVDNYLSSCSTEYISGYAATDIIHNNQPFIDEAWLSGTILNGTSSVTIPHGLTDGNSGLNPDCVVCTGSNGEVVNLYVTHGTTNVVVTNQDGNVTGDRTVYVYAKWKPT